LKFLVIPDDNQAIEAMRSGKIDILEGLSFQQAQTLLKANPKNALFYAIKSILRDNRSEKRREAF